MKRFGNLWGAVSGLPNLFAAAYAAARGKRKRPNVAAFLLDLENEVYTLHQEITQWTYTPGPYRTFLVHETKPRQISAAPFRDRVVHHALTRIIEPLFERRFTADSFACRTGFGTHRAIAAAQTQAKRARYALVCDISKFFASIDHYILKELLRRAIKCGPTLALADLIINASNDQEDVTAWFPGDDLFSPVERRRGLPLGNQTSQFFANVYLNPLDHHVRRVFKPAGYVRYVDDFILFADDKAYLAAMRREIVDFLAQFRLLLHPGKSRIHRTADGITFLGWRIFPDYRRLVRENVVRFRRRLRAMQIDYAGGMLQLADVKNRVSSWIGHAQYGNTWSLRSRILGEAVFSRGNAATTGVFCAVAPGTMMPGGCASPTATTTRPATGTTTMGSASSGRVADVSTA